MSVNFTFSNYEFSKMKKSKFEISKVYTIRIQRYRDLNIIICSKKLRTQFGFINFNFADFILNNL